MNRREFLKQAAAAGVVAINGVPIVQAAANFSAPERKTLAAANFIPELWSQEVLEVFKKNIITNALLNKKPRSA